MSQVIQQHKQASSLGVLDDELIRLIYSGPLETRPWLSFLQEMRRRLQSFHANIAFHRKAQPLGQVESIFDTDGDGLLLKELYENKYAAFDTVPYQDLQPGRIYQHDDLFTDKDIFYHEYLVAAGLEQLAILPIHEPGGTRAWLTFGRRSKPYSVRDCDAILALSSHLTVALQLFAAIKNAGTERDIYKEAFGSFAIGAILIDQSGHVGRIDAVADRILASNPELMVQDGRLRLGERRSNTELQQLVDTAINDHLSVPMPIFSRAMRLSDHGHLSLLIRSIAPGASSTHEKSTAAVIYLSDVRMENTAPAHKLMALFQLSASEAALAMQLAKGRTLAEAALVLNLSEQTARTYSKHIFAKTGTHRQAELVRLILTSVANLAG
jgi:DNA-binding CsgD family transcriptional regulator